MTSPRAATTPDYDDLPLNDTFGMRQSWGYLDPNIGTMSQVGPDDVLVAVSTVAVGETVALNLTLGEIDPPLFGRARYEHRVYATERNIFEDELNGWNPQSSSQWDGFRHVRAREHGFYGGVDDPDGSGDALGMEHLAAHGIVGRGVLIDVAAWAESEGRAFDPFGPEPIDATMLAAAVQHQGSQLRTGDILCVRTGWVGAYRRLDPQARADEAVWRQFAGLRADEGMARHLWNLRPGAVATDNPGFEWAPGSVEDGFLHRRLQPLLGVVMGELLDFETLSVRCRDLGRHEFLFVAAPLAVPGGLSSPANAVAIL